MNAKAKICWQIVFCFRPQEFESIRKPEKTSKLICINRHVIEGKTKQNKTILKKTKNSIEKKISIKLSKIFLFQFMQFN